MIRIGFLLSIVIPFIGLTANAFERVECMSRPDGSVYIFKSIPGQPDGLDVRIYHGWQFSEHSLPGIPIGIEDDFLNARYNTRTAAARARAIAGFSPLERLIFNMDTVFHHRFAGCELGEASVSCRETGPIKVGRAWISDVEFFFDTRLDRDRDTAAVYTVGIRGKSAVSGLAFSSGRRYFKYGDASQCLYLHENDW